VRKRGEGNAMIVLGFDTSTPSTVVGLRLADGTMLQARDDPEGDGRPGHATRLLPLAGTLLSEAGLGWSAITRIAVGVGPGTFTGLRIGVATARGLAQSLMAELVGISSLRALSHAVHIESPHDTAGVLAVIDARRGEVFVAAYNADSEVLRPHVLAPAEVDGLIEQVGADTGLERWIAVGDGVIRYRHVLDRSGVSVPGDDSMLHQIDARAICGLGSDPAAIPPIAQPGGFSLGDMAVVPDYLRRPDAEITLEGATS
jgi:tRNA threonylcarbamoyladenosine biosynthesis protein TsaB